MALISGEGSPLVDRFALKMGITDVHKNCKDKAEAFRSFAKQERSRFEARSASWGMTSTIWARSASPASPLPRPTPSPTSCQRLSS